MPKMFEPSSWLLMKMIEQAEAKQQKAWLKYRRDWERAMLERNLREDMQNDHRRHRFASDIGSR
jgi:hypothetical protein